MSQTLHHEALQVETWTERSWTTGHQIGFREIIFLCYWWEHGCSSLTESSHALVSPKWGDSSPHLPLYPPPPSIVSEEDRAGPLVNNWKRASHSDLNGHIIVNLCNQPKELYDDVFETFLAGNTKEIYQSLKPVSGYYRNKAWIKHIGVHSF